MTDYKAKEDKAIPDEPRLPARPTLTLDVALYQEYLDDAELSAEQKQEFIETLWNIIVAFVDLGFGIHPVQQVMSEKDTSCGQTKDESAANLSDLVSSWDGATTGNRQSCRPPGKDGT